MQVGLKLATEAFPPDAIVRQTVRAEEAGFDFVEMSDHFHPWLDNQGHSAFTWSLLGAMAARTERIGLVTGVTCPIIRYHPAVIAQAAATVQLLSGNRFTLGVGAGERLNEHVVGKGWPAVHVRHEMLREALQIIKLLWQGGYQTFEGKHLQLEDARVFDLPDQLPVTPSPAAGATPRPWPPSTATGCSPPSRARTWSAPTATPAGPVRATPRCRWPGPPTRTPARRRRWRPAAGR
ncbi:TIGR03557 family F420-dependent LLM class oxidoreductase [Geodermatophilus sp. SYSU D00696]